MRRTWLVVALIVLAGCKSYSNEPRAAEPATPELATPALSESERLFKEEMERVFKEIDQSPWPNL